MKHDLEVLVSSLEKDPYELALHMNLECDVVIVNQACNESCLELKTNNGYDIRVLESGERGIGRSRNLALDNAEGRIVLFSDDDIVYSEGYAGKIKEEFDSDPEADIIMFNFNVSDDMKTYHTDKKKRVCKWSVGRYPAYAAAAKLESIRRSGVRFSTLFGGGARYSNGEDSLFFMDCLRAGLIIKAVPITIGTEEPGESTWFHGYDRKFFKDRGVLYSFLYGKLATVWALRFVLAKKHLYAGSIKPADAFRMMKDGIREGKAVKRENPNGQ